MLQTSDATIGGIIIYIHLLKNREITGKLDVCYVAVVSLFSELPQDTIQKIIEGIPYAILSKAKAFKSESEAENHAQNKIKSWVEKNPNFNKLTNPEYLTSFSKDHIKENAYWILTVTGKPGEISTLLSKGIRGYEEFGKRVIYAVNKGRNNQIIPERIDSKENKNKKI